MKSLVIWTISSASAFGTPVSTNLATQMRTSRLRDRHQLGRHRSIGARGRMQLDHRLVGPAQEKAFGVDDELRQHVVGILCARRKCPRLDLGEVHDILADGDQERPLGRKIVGLRAARYAGPACDFLGREPGIAEIDQDVGRGGKQIGRGLPAAFLLASPRPGTGLGGLRFLYHRRNSSGASRCSGIDLL